MNRTDSSNLTSDYQDGYFKAFREGEKKGRQDAEKEFMQWLESTLEQFKIDWENSAFDIPDFVKDFFEVSQDKIKTLQKQQVGK